MYLLCAIDIKNRMLQWKFNKFQLRGPRSWLLYFDILLQHDQPRHGLEHVLRVDFQAGMSQIMTNFIYTFSTLKVAAQNLV